MYIYFLCIHTHKYKFKKAKSLQKEEMGNQDKAGWGRSKWLKSEEEADVAVRFGLKDSSVRL